MKQVSDTELKIILNELKHTAKYAGDVVEFGCYKGDTSVELARILRGTKKSLWLYDSFEGLPEKSNADCSSAGDSFQLGGLKTSKTVLVNRFKKSGLDLPYIKKAWFSDLKPRDLPEQICFAFLDGDFYESIRDSLKLIEDRTVEGCVIIVDDYASEALPGVERAVCEWMDKNPQAKLRVENSLAIIYCRPVR